MKAPCLNYAVYSGYMLPRPLRGLDELLVCGRCNVQNISTSDLIASGFIHVHGMTIVWVETDAASA